jgi:2-phosphoglycerate kinase
MIDENSFVVVDPQATLPFSKGLMAQSLMSTGLPPELAYDVAAAVERYLQRTGGAAVTLARLRTIACDTLGQVEGNALISSFVQWQQLWRLERPLIILIGGTTGVGKSTLASQVAHRLGIVRISSTDTIRQVMRAFFSVDLMPAIHTSSFDAAAAVRVPMPRGTDLSKMGFIEQTKDVCVGIDAVVERALEEAQSIILEGVHVVPGFLDHSRWHDALVLEFVLSIADPDRHRSHFAVREFETGGVRPLQRYLAHFAQIRRIQKYILARASQYNVTVVDNRDIDAAVKTVMTAILQAVSESHRSADEQGARPTLGEIQSETERMTSPPTAVERRPAVDH